MNLKDIQLTLIRVYLGLEFIPHFAGKFGLAGQETHDAVLAYFGTVVNHPQEMFLLAGLCEFAAFIGLTFGLFTRVAALGTSVYLLITLFTGHHNTFGFTWVNPGGGWEYPALWSFVCLTFVLSGGGRWSIDHWLQPCLPQALRRLST